MLQGAFVPFAASAALFAGYLVVKFFPDLDVAKVLNGYFWFIGSIAVAGALRQPLRRAVSLCCCFLPSSMWQPRMWQPLICTACKHGQILVESCVGLLPAIGNPLRAAGMCCTRARANGDF